MLFGSKPFSRSYLCSQFIKLITIFSFVYISVNNFIQFFLYICNVEFEKNIKILNLESVSITVDSHCNTGMITHCKVGAAAAGSDMCVIHHTDFDRWAIQFPVLHFSI